jgi:hypothetical protein
MLTITRGLPSILTVTAQVLTVKATLPEHVEECACTVESSEKQGRRRS